jgi:hypothetical protein
MAVERSRWTDERLDELAERVMRQDVLEVRFDGLEARFDGLERRFESLERTLGEFRAEMKAELGEIRSSVNGLRGELYETRRWLMTMWLTGLLALIAVFVEISLRT